MAEPDWSLLPSDTLEQISKLVSADSDHIRFRSVCASWRRSAPKRPQLPFLILFRRRPRDGPHGGNIVFTFCKLSFDGGSGGKIVPNRNLPESDLPIGISCIGSFHGYIALVGDPSHSILISNPLTNSEIHLPNPSIPRHCNAMAVSSNPATSSSDFAALASLFLYQAGGDGVDDKWTPLQCPRLGQAKVQSCCWHRGRFFLAASGEVYACDLGPVPRVRAVASVTRESAGLPWISMARLVESDGHLLLVLEYQPPRAPTQGCSFAVFKLELGEPTKLMRLDGLGNKALFLSHHNSLSFSVSRFPGSKANDIYYEWCYYDPDRRILTNKLKLRNLKDGRDEFVNDDAILHLGNWESFAWFTPSL